MPMSLLKKVFFFFLAENKELLFSTGLRRMLSKLALELDFHFDLVIYAHTHETHANINLSLITYHMDTTWTHHHLSTVQNLSNGQVVPLYITQALFLILISHAK